MVKEIKENEFENVIKEGKVLIDCYANWCGPCKMLSPIIDEISEELKDYNFYKLDVDTAEQLVLKYNVMSIPTLLIFDNGLLKQKVIGFKSKDDLLEILKK